MTVMVKTSFENVVLGLKSFQMNFTRQINTKLVCESDNWSVGAKVPPYPRNYELQKLENDFSIVFWCSSKFNFSPPILLLNIHAIWVETFYLQMLSVPFKRRHQLCLMWRVLTSVKVVDLAPQPQTVQVSPPPAIKGFIILHNSLERGYRVCAYSRSLKDYLVIRSLLLDFIRTCLWWTRGRVYEETTWNIPLPTPTRWTARPTSDPQNWESCESMQKKALQRGGTQY